MFGTAEKRGDFGLGFRRVEAAEPFRRTTEWMKCMSHRKWRETKQQPSMLPCPVVPIKYQSRYAIFHDFT